MQAPRTVAAIGFLTTALVVVLVGVILIAPKDRSQYFWYRVLWTDFLAALIWAYVGCFLSVAGPNRLSRRFAGVVPAHGFVIVTYAVLSFALMLGFAWLDPSEPPSRPHMALQVVLAAILVILSSLLVLPALSASNRQDTTPSETAYPPFHLASQIRSEEDRFATPFATPTGGAVTGDLERSVHQALKTLRERILYSLEGISGVEGDSHYMEFAERVMRLCRAFSTVTVPLRTPSEIQDQMKEIQSLIRMTGTLGQSLKRR